jgi:hypothetical protein
MEIGDEIRQEEDCTVSRPSNPSNNIASEVPGFLGLRVWGKERLDPFATSPVFPGTYRIHSFALLPIVRIPLGLFPVNDV